LTAGPRSAMRKAKLEGRVFNPGNIRLLRSGFLLLAVFAPLAGCVTAMTALVGKNPKETVTVPPAPPPLLNSGFVAANGGLQTPAFGGSAILPPTMPLRLDDNANSDSETDTSPSPGPHKPIAALPFSPDPNVLVPLGMAANKIPASDARFVLLVLAPPAADAATLDRTTQAARLAANAAVRALADAGIAAERVEVAMATSPDVGAGELRLYVR
jgi:hypothetical protein